MPTLILSGGTGKDKEKKIINLFLKKVKNKKILYIPLAKDTRSLEDSYEWFSSTIRKDFTMLTSFKEKINLSEFKGIFIGGGNTFKLLKEIKENKWESKLKNFKGIIYGGSAGAIIFGRDISTASFGACKDKNLVKLKDSRCLNLVNNYDLQCHYLPKEKPQVLNHMKKSKTPIIALPEDSGILVEDNKITPINKIYIFKAKSL